MPASLSTQPAESRSRLAALAAYAAVPYPSLDDAINAVLALLADLIGISLTMIHRLDGDTLVVSHACDRIGLGLTLPVTIPRAHTFCDAVLASLEPLVIADADAHEQWRSLPGKVFVGTRSYASVPIVLGNGRVFGTLCAHDRRVLDLGEPELDAMRILARLIASQIERDDGLRRESAAAAQLARQNQDLQDALHQLDALRKVVESISRHLDLQGLMQQVIQSAVTLLNAHGGAISLVGESVTAPRRLVATYNLGETDVATRSIPATAGLMGEIIARREPVILPAYAALGDPLPDAVFHRLGPWIGVPIWWQDEIVGTFGVAANDPQRSFGEREVTILSLLAKHAAIGIENARLFAANHELGISEERNRLAREIHDTLAQSLLTLTFQIRAARGLVSNAPAQADSELAAAEAQARAALDDARRSVWNLGPAALESGSLLQALQAEAATARPGAPCAFTKAGTPRPLDAEAQLALLRVMQETVANARRHSGC
ncbi:MAG: GAF domain-containing protein, partial [Thermomicrobiales bacterium]|nr:GAF domain-containing protein [Thermomicrobiales bacterium]